MSLSSLLLPSKSKQKKGTEFDHDLDALFKSSSSKFPTERPKATITETNTRNAAESSTQTLKRKHDAVQAESSIPDATVKRAKAQIEKQKVDKKKTEAKKDKGRKSGGKRNKASDDEDIEDEDSEDDEDDDSDLENTYLLSRSKTAADASRKKNRKASEADVEVLDNSDGDANEMDVDEEMSVEEDEDDTDADAEPPQHESLSSKSKKGKDRTKPKRKEKHVPEGETPEQRDSRTIFIGNLSLEVAQKKPLLKALQRHILSLIPPIPNLTAKPKIESTRFRSIPFSVPTSRPPDADDDDSKKKSSSKSSSRQHETERSSSWKSKSKSKRDQEDADAATDQKKFLTPSQKKKIAFINQEFHSSADTVHAYIVFAHPPPSSVSNSTNKSKPNLPPPPEIMDPYTAARLAKEHGDGSLFMERALRVDVVAKSALAIVKSSKETEQIIKTDIDPKRCVFVGSLDFESKEEDLRVFFEGVVSAVMGPREVSNGDVDGDVDEDDEEDDEGEENEDEDEGRSSQADDSSEESDEDVPHQKKPKAAKTADKTKSITPGKKQTNIDGSKRWVTRVRIIRDKDTQLGKGFAYVQFATRECVDEILALEPSKLKFAKRKLRVERCKTLPGGRSRVKVSSSSSQSKSKSNNSKPGDKGRNSKSGRDGKALASNGPIPKGDPNLGQKLAHLSKEERKAAKAADADRMARRLAKKKSRMAMGADVGTGSGKGTTKGIGTGRVTGKGTGKGNGKDKTRERKNRSSMSMQVRGKVKGHAVGSSAKNKGKRKSDKSLEKKNLKK